MRKLARPPQPRPQLSRCRALQAPQESAVSGAPRVCSSDRASYQQLIACALVSNGVHPILTMARRASEDGRPAVVLYFSDFDPSGHQMPVSVARKLQALRDLYYPNLRIKLYPVALTLEQIRALRLPSSPLKETERRASRWRETHGHDQTEIDAMVELHPGALRRAVFDAINPFYDDGLEARVRDVEFKWRKQADEALRAHPGYKGASRRIKTAWGRAKAAADKLHSEQHQLAGILQSSIPAPPALPKAKPEGAAKPPLFDSETEFVAATRKLIRHKKLIGSE